jgi:DNA-binding SARP family transcriptional activator
MPDLPSLQLQCFGAPTVRVAGRAAPPEVRWHKHLALLAYLALSPDRTRTRSHLVGLLWPEKEDEKARHSLDQALTRLRHNLGSRRFTSRGDALTLADAALEVDALQFDALVDRDPAAALALVRGEFLEGFAVDGAPAFEDWAMERRTHYSAQLTAAILSGGEGALASLRYGDAISAARRALSIQPYSGRAITLLMRTAALSGEAAVALAAFHDFSVRLEADIHERPGRDLSALAERIRGGRWRAPRPDPKPERAPLVGRESLHRAVFGAVDEAIRHGPRTLLIIGDPGTGKTRLLRECMDRAALDGALVAIAQPLDSDQDVAWSLLRGLLRTGLLTAPGAVAADAEALDVLARLVPETAEAATPHGRADVGQVAAALAALLHALADEQAVAIGVGDAQASDGPSLDALGAALAQLTTVPVLTVLTTSPTWDQLPPELLRLRAEIGRSVPGIEVRLEPLSQAETRLLVLQRSGWCANDEERERLARRVYFETSGNPFLITTLLRALGGASSFRVEVLAWPPPGATDDSPLPISVPQLARRAITATIARLDRDAQQVLQAAAIGGTVIDLELVVALTELPRGAVEAALATLEHSRLVTFETGRYLIAAPLIAQVVLAEWLLPGERHVLRDHAISALASRGDPQSRLLRVQLMALDQPGPPAFDAAIDLANLAVAAGTRGAARQALAAAAQALPTGDTIRRNMLAALRAALPSGSDPQVTLGPRDVTEA